MLIAGSFAGIACTKVLGTEKTLNGLVGLVRFDALTVALSAGPSPRHRARRLLSARARRALNMQAKTGTPIDFRGGQSLIVLFIAEPQLCARSSGCRPRRLLGQISKGWNG